MTRAVIRNLNKLHNYNAINFQHLRYAIAAADYGSFRSAAETLMIQQPTLGRCVRQLEHTIGISVFDRYSGWVRATQFGQSFLRVARSILEQVDSMVVSAQMTERGERGRPSVGFYTSLTAGDLRATIVEYTQQFPHVVSELLADATAEQWRMRLTGFSPLHRLS